MSTQQSFAWAQPSVAMEEKSSTKKSPVPNPLLKRRGGVIPPAAAADNNVHRSPFSPLNGNNNTLRQRRPTTTTTKPLPPKMSLTDGGFNDFPSSTTTTTTTTSVTVDEPRNEPNNVDNNNNENNNWVLVFGFHKNNDSILEEVLDRFESIGTITAKKFSHSSSNWVALRYGSLLEADKAACQNRCVLSSGDMVGATRLTTEDLRSLDASSAMTVWNHNDNNGKRKRRMTESEVLLQEAPRKANSSICEQFLAIIFGWD